MEKAIEILKTIVKALGDHPDEVRVESSTDEMGVLLTLHVNPEDMGKIIGRAGNTAKAIRVILRTIGMKESARINLKIAEPEGSERSEQTASEDSTG